MSEENVTLSAERWMATEDIWFKKSTMIALFLDMMEQEMGIELQQAWNDNIPEVADSKTKRFIDSYNNEIVPEINKVLNTVLVEIPSKFASIRPLFGINVGLSKETIDSIYKEARMVDLVQQDEILFIFSNVTNVRAKIFQAFEMFLEEIDDFINIMEGYKGNIQAIEGNIESIQAQLNSNKDKIKTYRDNLLSGIDAAIADYETKNATAKNI